MRGITPQNSIGIQIGGRGVLPAVLPPRRAADPHPVEACGQARFFETFLVEATVESALAANRRTA
ncbi:hypothetical protein ACS15_3681 [Ralstonia insidiosa]|uniref:Uncharacterized protein n=1 Tax=Ralstonia insidiosa TaxID=190721 RepID=A0AAC9BE72_9RALS|nr:hypothetical protein ACS15_3681 [Ralstonia insidiosa]